MGSLAYMFADGLFEDEVGVFLELVFHLVQVLFSQEPIILV
jgi:hypothetical protein